MKDTTTTTKDTTSAPVAPVNNSTTERKEGITMNDTRTPAEKAAAVLVYKAAKETPAAPVADVPAPVADVPAPVADILSGKVKAAAARKYAAEYARETLAAAHAAVIGGACLAAALAPVDVACRCLAAAMSGKKGDETINYTPVPAAVLYAAAVTYNKAGKYTVKGPGFIRGFAKNKEFTAAETVPAAVLPDDAYKAAPAARAPRKPATRSPFDEFVSRMYSMEKAANKAATPAGQNPVFPAFNEWFTTEKKAMYTAAAAVLNIAA